MDIVLLGAPGAGKGTQGELLAQWLGMSRVSTGELFRSAVEAKTRLGLAAKSFMDRGELVPDEVTVAMVAERVQQPDCAVGVILDGFPRTVAQAQALDAMLMQLGRCVGVVPYVKVSRDVALQRIVGRWTCRSCGAVFHELYYPEKTKGICDACGQGLYQRPDDTPVTQSRRIEVYLDQTAPLIEYYRSRGVLIEIDGEQGVDRVQQELRSAIGAAPDCRAR